MKKENIRAKVFLYIGITFLVCIFPSYLIFTNAHLQTGYDFTMVIPWFMELSIILLITLLYKITKVIEMAIEKNTMEEKIKGYQNQIDMYVLNQHELLNHFHRIYSLIDMNRPKEAIRYIEKAEKQGRGGLSLTKITHPEISGLLASFLVSANKQDTIIEFHILDPWEHIDVPFEKLTTVLNNLLENALQAVINVSEKKILVSFYKHDQRYFLTVSNTGTPIPYEIKEKIFEKGFTTKSNGTGFGLYLTRKILSEYSGTIDLVKHPDYPITLEVSIPVIQTHKAAR